MGHRAAASEAKATLRQEVFGLFFIGGGSRREGGRRRPSTEGAPGAKAREPEPRAAPPPSAARPPRPSPTLAAPRDPHQARNPAWRPRRRRAPAPSPCPGTREPVPPPPPAYLWLPPRRSPGWELPLPPPRWIRIHYPLPHPLTWRGRASFSGVRRGGENQCHVTANCPRLPFPRQSGPPLAA